MKECNFSYVHYAEILELAIKLGYKFYPFTVSRILPDQKGIWLRHDIDVSPYYATKMSEIEKSLGVSSTYFFFVGCPTYSITEKKTREIIEKIKEDGHQIGRHLIFENASMLGKTEDKIYTTTIFSVHQPDKAILHKDTVPPSTYSPRFMDDMLYISDSRGSWKNQCVCKYIQDGIEKIQILIHPIWWGNETIDYRLERIKRDRMIDIDKYFEENHIC